MPFVHTPADKDVWVSVKNRFILAQFDWTHFTIHTISAATLILKNKNSRPVIQAGKTNHYTMSGCGRLKDGCWLVKMYMYMFAAYASSRHSVKVSVFRFKKGKKVVNFWEPLAVSSQYAFAGLLFRLLQMGSSYVLMCSWHDVLHPNAKYKKKTAMLRLYSFLFAWQVLFKQ